MTRTMGDSVNLAAIPLTVDMVGVYCNGDFAVDPALVARRFPPAKYVIVWYDVFGNAPDRAQILDVENGAASTARAPGWVRARRSVVHTSLPTLYCNRSTMTTLIRTCSVSGLVAGRDYQLGISTLDGTEDFNGVPLKSIPGVVFCQLKGGPTAPYDLSKVYDDKWHPLAKAA